MPVVMTKRKLESLSDGQVLEVVTDNEPSTKSIEKWAKDHGHEILEASKVDDSYRIKIRKR